MKKKTIIFSDIKLSLWIKYLLSCLTPIIVSLATSAFLSMIISLSTSTNTNIFQPQIKLALYLAILPPVLLIFDIILKLPFEQNILHNIRKKMFLGIINQTLQDYEQHSKDEYISYILNDVSTFESDCFNSLYDIIKSAGIIFFTYIIITIINYKFSIILIVYSAIIFIISFLFRKLLHIATINHSNKNSEYTVEISNIFNGMEQIVTNNAQDKFIDKCNSLIDAQTKTKENYHFLSQLQNIMSNHLSVITNVCFMVLIATEIVVGKMPTNEILFILILINVMIRPILDFMKSYNKFKISIDLINKRIIKNTTKSNFKYKYTFNNEIHLNNISYNIKNKRIINPISLSIKKDEKYILVGKSGSGKSTLMKILSNLITDYHGCITIDDIDIREIYPSSFNENIAYISQNTYLFEDSLRNNITLYKDYSDEEIYYALSKAGLNDFMKKNNNNLDMKIIDNGKNISGGEKQRISIARALLKKADIIFADEITSNLPQDISIEIEKTLYNIDCTLIYISHNINYLDNYNVNIIEVSPTGNIKLKECDNYEC